MLMKPHRLVQVKVSLDAEVILQRMYEGFFLMIFNQYLVYVYK